MSEPSSSQRCYLHAIRLLAARAYSAHKLGQKLREKGHKPEVVQETIQLLLEKKYLDEASYAQALAKQLLRKGLGNTVIQKKLSQQKLSLSNQQLQHLRTEFGTGEAQQIEEIIRKKAYQLELKAGDPEQLEKWKNRVLRNLLSKGHRYELAKQELQKFLDS